MANNLMIWLAVSVFALHKHGEFVLLFDGLSMYSGPLPPGTDGYTFYSGSHVVALRCLLLQKDSWCLLCVQTSNEPNPELWFREDGCAGPCGFGDFPKPWHTVLVWRCGCCLLNSLPYLFVTYVSFTSLILNFVVFFSPQFIFFFSKMLK